jgi:hypothetical protein
MPSSHKVAEKADFSHCNDAIKNQRVPFVLMLVVETVATALAQWLKVGEVVHHIPNCSPSLDNRARRLPS